VYSRHVPERLKNKEVLWFEGESSPNYGGFFSGEVFDLHPVELSKKPAEYHIDKQDTRNG
jgi:hypothetical protein